MVFSGQSFIEQLSQFDTGSLSLHFLSRYIFLVYFFPKTQSCEPKGMPFRGKPMSFGEINILLCLLCHFHQKGLWKGYS